MSAYDVVLALHILAVIFGFGVAAVAHSTMFRLRSATSVAEMRGHARVLNRTGPLFPVAALLLLVLGGLLIHLSASPDRWHWSDGWIDTAIVVLVVAEGLGGGVIGRRMKAVDRQLASTPDGPVDVTTRQLTADKPVWLVSHLNTATIASVVLLMTTKPSGVVSVVVVLIAAAVGLASALPFIKPAAVAAAPA